MVAPPGCAAERKDLISVLEAVSVYLGMVLGRTARLSDVEWAVTHHSSAGGLVLDTVLTEHGHCWESFLCFPKFTVYTSSVDGNTYVTDNQGTDNSACVVDLTSDLTYEVLHGRAVELFGHVERFSYVYLARVLESWLCWNCLFFFTQQLQMGCTSGHEHSCSDYV